MKLSRIAINYCFQVVHFISRYQLPYLFRSTCSVVRLTQQRWMSKIPPYNNNTSETYIHDELSYRTAGHPTLLSEQFVSF